MMQASSIMPLQEQCTYTSCYCEENVWKLCEHVQKCHNEELNNCYAVFISNEKRAIPLWNQKARKAADFPVIWDYHVILAYKRPNCSQVFDLDSLLAFPCPFQEYFASGIRVNATLKREFWRMFRVIPAADFLASFASDRSHMLKDDGIWLATPPTYPAICTKECSNNIQQCISMDPSEGFGKVLTLEEFHAFFTS